MESTFKPSEEDLAPPVKPRFDSLRGEYSPSFKSILLSSGYEHRITPIRFVTHEKVEKDDSAPEAVNSVKEMQQGVEGVITHLRDNRIAITEELEMAVDNFGEVYVSLERLLKKMNSFDDINDYTKE